MQRWKLAPVAIWPGDHEGYRYRHNHGYGQWHAEPTRHTWTRTRLWMVELQQTEEKQPAPRKFCHFCSELRREEDLIAEEWLKDDSLLARTCTRCAPKGRPPAPFQLWRPHLCAEELRIAAHVKCGCLEGIVVKAGRTPEDVGIVTVSENRFVTMSLATFQEAGPKVVCKLYNDGWTFLFPGFIFDNNQDKEYPVLRPVEVVALALKFAEFEGVHKWTGADLAIFCHTGKFTHDLGAVGKTVTKLVPLYSDAGSLFVCLVRNLLARLQAPIPQEALSELLDQGISALRVELSWAGVAAAVVSAIQIIFRGVQLYQQRITPREFWLAVLHDVLSTGLGGLVAALCHLIPVPIFNTCLSVAVNIAVRFVVDLIFRQLGWEEPKERHKSAEFAVLLEEGHPILDQAMVTGQELHAALLARTDLAEASARVSEALQLQLLSAPQFRSSSRISVEVFEHERYWLTTGRWAPHFHGPRCGRFTLGKTDQSLGASLEEAEEAILQNFPGYTFAH